MAQGPGNHSHFGRFPVAALLIFSLAALTLVGCGKRQAGTAQINAITQDLAAAAQSAAGGRAQISIRPEMGHLGSNPPSLVADDIFISLPSAERLSPVEQAIERVATRHRLKRTSRTAGPGILRSDYSIGGRRTHSIEIVVATPERKSGLPRLAIIIDDIGNDKLAAETLLKLPYPITLSILPDQPHSSEIAEGAYRRGDQVLLHLPMEFEGNTAKAEPVELRAGMPASEVHRLLGQMLSNVPHAVGVNNHEGSLATAQPQLMAELMSDLRERGLFFIDSRTTPATVAYSAAQRAGVPAASRKVFLDDNETRDAIIRQLDLAARDAAASGSAIAIGHPHPATIAALTEELPRLNSRVRLVFASSLVR